jgi:hypothetical protein
MDNTIKVLVFIFIIITLFCLFCLFPFWALHPNNNIQDEDPAHYVRFCDVDETRESIESKDDSQTETAETNI